MFKSLIIAFFKTISHLNFPQQQLATCWFSFAKMKFLEQKCEKASFDIIISMAEYIEDESLQAFSHLHLAMNDFAFVSSKDKAREHFKVACELKKDAPQVTINIYLY